MADIFISYVSEDSAVAVAVAEGLDAQGLSAWYYERDSVPGVSYLVQVGEAIEQSLAVVLVVSRASLGSHQVTTEVVRAYEAKKPILPIRLDVSHDEFQRRQPEWRTAIGAATSIALDPANATAITPRLVAGLRRLGVVRPQDEVVQAEPRSASDRATFAGPPDSNEPHNRGELPALSASTPEQADAPCDGPEISDALAMARVVEVRIVLNWGANWQSESEVSIHGAKEPRAALATATATGFARELRSGAWDQDEAEAGVKAIVASCFAGSVDTVGFDLSYPSGVYFDRPYCNIQMGFDRRLSSLPKRDNRIAQVWVELFHDRMELNFGDDDGSGLDYDVDFIGSLSVDFASILRGAQQVAAAFKMLVPGRIGKPFLKTDRDRGEVICVPLVRASDMAAQQGVAADVPSVRR